MKVTLENKTIEVNKLPLGKYSELLKAIKNIFPQLGSLSGKTTAEIIMVVPDLIEQNSEEVLRLIEIGSGLSTEEVHEIGLNECIDLIIAIFEVNKYSEVYEKIKKASARLREVNQVNGLPVQ